MLGFLNLFDQIFRFVVLYFSYKINSIYNYEKINSLFKNFDTLSFIDLLFNYNNLVKKGYNNLFLKHSFHSMLSMPFFLFIMTALAAILILNTLKKSDNLKSKATQLKSYDLQFSAKIKDLVQQSKFFEEHDQCPTCDQQIDESIKNTKACYLEKDAY